MEEKYPIKFSLSQFILLLGVEVIVLALVFLLGARFGGTIFTGFISTPTASGPYQSLDPKSPAANNSKVMKSQDSKLVDSLDPAEEPAEEEANGEAKEQQNVAAQEEAGEAEDVGNKNLQINKSLIHSVADKNTMVRFKSSGNTKFTIEVNHYFDEVMASQEITKLKQKGYEAFLVIDQQRSGVPQYSVRVGSFGDRRMAEQLSVKMSNEQGLELRVVQVD